MIRQLWNNVIRPSATTYTSPSFYSKPTHPVVTRAVSELQNVSCNCSLHRWISAGVSPHTDSHFVTHTYIYIYIYTVSSRLQGVLLVWLGGGGSKWRTVGFIWGRCQQWWACSIGSVIMAGENPSTCRTNCSYASMFITDPTGIDPSTPRWEIGRWLTVWAIGVWNIAVGCVW